MTEKVGVIAFGWVHFKACCAERCLDWRNVVHVTRPELLDAVDVVIMHDTAQDWRLAAVRAAARNRGLI